MCKWIKASERLPDNMDRGYYGRFINGVSICLLSFTSDGIKWYSGEAKGTAFLKEVEWLDESAESELQERVRKLREGVGEIANYGTFLTADDAYEMNELAKQLLKETEG